MTPMWESAASQSSASFSVLREISVLSEQNWSGIWSRFQQKIWCILYTVQEGASWALVRDRLCSAPLISWLTSSQDGAEKCVQPSWALFLKRPRGRCAEATFMTQNWGDESGPPPSPQARVFCSSLSGIERSAVWRPRETPMQVCTCA